MPTDLAVSPRHLSLPECALFNPTELRISGSCTQDEFQRIGKALIALDHADRLWQSDFAAYAIRRWGDRGLELAAEATQLAKHYLKRVARVAEVFPPAVRRPELNRTHYLKLLPFEPEKLAAWLPTVDLKNISARSLYLLAVDEFGKPDPKTQPPKKKTIHLREDLWARLAPHSLSKNISVLVELIIESWLQRPLSEQEIITADLEQRRVKHNANQRAQNEKKKAEREAEKNAERECRQIERERRQEERLAEKERIAAARRSERARKMAYKEEQRVLHSETPEVGVRKYTSKVRIVFTSCRGETADKHSSSRFSTQAAAETAAAEYSADRGYPVTAVLCEKCSGAKQVWHVK